MARMNEKEKTAVLLVGHGAAAKDCPREWITQLKALEGRRRATGQAPTPEEIELDSRVRNWPRTPQTDPYKTGLESLAAHLKPLLNGTILATAFNEFCAPTIESAVEELTAKGVTRIKIIPSMMTPGGAHSEVEIPAILESLRAHYPEVDFTYIWPFNLDRLARVLVEHLNDS